MIPTLSGGSPLWECVASLQAQDDQDFLIVIVDNSGSRLVDRTWPESAPRSGVKILHPGTNTGFGSAVNLAARSFPSEFVAVINDDAVADPAWLGAAIADLAAHPDAGSVAAQVHLAGLNPPQLDSAAMLIAADGTSKQRGHGQSPTAFLNAEEALLPSGSAAVYRRAMLEQTGGFDDDFFLYCEDTDLGLRARWAGWTCRYVPAARVHHHYSLSAGRVSPLKAFYVERNRLRTIIKNFPLARLIRAFLATPLRYLHHLLAMRAGQGAAARFQQESGATALVVCVLRAHLDALRHLPTLIRQRRAIRRSARIRPAAFNAALDRFALSLREVAAL